MSVTMPCYNAAKTLPLALASLVEQTYENWECLVIDDGSTDDPRSIVEALGDSRVRFVRLPENRGRAVARQVALEHARGETLTMLDADDWYYPDKLGIQVAAMTADPSLAVVANPLAVFDEGYRLLGSRPAPPDRARVGRYEVLRGVPVPPVSSMIRMAVARKYRYEPTLRRSQDTAFLIEVLLGRGYALLPEVVYAYREPVGSIRSKVRGTIPHRLSVSWSFRRRYPLASLRQVGLTLTKAVCYEAAFLLRLDGAIAARRNAAVPAAVAAGYAEALARVAARTEAAKP